LLRVYSNALDQAPDPALAFRIGARLHVSSYGMYGYALMCAPTLRQAYDVAQRYHPLAAPVVPLHWEERDGSAAWVFPGGLVFDEHDVPPRLARFLLELQAAIHVTLHRDIMGADCLPSHVRVFGPPPWHATPTGRTCSVRSSSVMRATSCTTTCRGSTGRRSSPIRSLPTRWYRTARR
jgi:hypothetical protein